MAVAKVEFRSGRELPLRLEAAREETDRLFTLVRPEFLYERPIAERHRIIFYIGHLEAFDWNLLRERAFDLPSFSPELDKLFAFGIDPVDGGLPADTKEDWPRPEQVDAYLGRIRSELDRAVLDRLRAPAIDPSLIQLLNVAIEHRLMHAETLSYMLHRMPFQQKTSVSPDPQVLAPPFKPQMIDIPSGAAKLGLHRAAGQFGWDNEFEENPLNVPAFAIDKYMVTNGEYLKFVDAGGYADSSHWARGDWEWIQTARITHPSFWILHNRQWYQRGMFREVPLPMDWPVYVSHAEATAYAHWAGKALPTEAQWQRAAYGSPEGEEREFPWGSGSLEGRRGNFDFRRWDPSPVQAYDENASAFGVEGLLGDGWEWTSSVFAPFPGFEPFPFYRGYSADFFDDKHFVMKGGSTRTAGCLLRASFRNWFQPHYPYVYAGFRCVKN
jgi:iron(II)-dependent oxidoreductase